jgi:hypothetical protein
MEEATDSSQFMGKPPNGLELLAEDHAAIRRLFERYRSLDDDESKRALTAKIVLELGVHVWLEEEVFYPALWRGCDRKFGAAPRIEHAMAKRLLAELHAHASSAARDRNVEALSDLFQHHVRADESYMFDQAVHHRLDLKALGAQLEAYRAALRSRYAAVTGVEELADFLSAPPTDSRGPIGSGEN